MSASAGSQPLAVSSYLIASDHMYQDANGRHVRLFLSGRTGAFKALPEALAESLYAGQVPDSRAAHDQLAEVGFLVPEGEDELAAIIERNRRKQRAEGVLEYVLLPTSFCNMGCEYCGQEHSQDGPMDDWERAVIAHVTEGIARPTTNKVHISWFGGEPMAGYPRLIRVSRALTEAADGAGVRYSSSMTTNGSLLTVKKLIELREVARVSVLCITLDSTPELHDRRRFLKGGGTSFSKITEVLTAALREPALSDVTFRMRTNVDTGNREALLRYFQHMKELGFDHPQVLFELYPVHPWSNDVSAVELARTEYANAEIDWLAMMTRLGLQCGLVPAKARPVVCVATQPSATVVSSTGAVFSCTEHVLVPKHEANDAVGSLDSAPGTRRSLGLFHDFDKRVQNADVPCHSCRFYGVCGGACPKHWAEGHSPCPSYKYNIQDRFDIYAVSRGLRIL